MIGRATGGVTRPPSSRAAVLIAVLLTVLGALILLAVLGVALGWAGSSRLAATGVSSAEPLPSPPGPGATSGATPAPPSGSAAAAQAPSSVPARTARRTGSVVPEAPRQVRLPDGRTVPVEAVSSKADGRLDVPDDIRRAGWFRGGSALGDPFGSTLLAAHVDSFTQGLGPFERLLTARRGEQVTVTGRRLTQTFRITSLRLVPQGSLRDDRWIYSPAGERRLTLVTCAPPYDRSRGGYQNLAVVTALPVTDAPVQKG